MEFPIFQFGPFASHSFTECHYKRPDNLLYVLHYIFKYMDKIPVYVCHILKAEEMHKKSWCNNFIYFIAYTCCQNDQTFWQTLSVHNTYWWTPSTSQSFPTSLGAMFCRVLGQISINLQRSDQPICKTKMQLF